MKQKLLVLLVMALFVPLAASAYDACIDGIYYNIVKKAKQATVTYGDNKNGTYSGDVVIPETVVYDGVTCDVIGIDEYAFSYIKLSSLTIPKSIKKIAVNAFDGTGTYYSNNNGIGKLYISDVASWCSIEFDEENSSVNYVSILNPLECTSQLYINNVLTTALVIPDNVSEIGCSAFRGAKMLTSVKLPSNLISIGTSAFRNCTNIQELIIPDKVEAIGLYAFYKCSALKSVTMGKGVKSIGVDAFAGCESIIDVHITDLRAWCNIEFKYVFTTQQSGIGIAGGPGPKGNSSPLSCAQHLYLNGQELTDIVIPDGVEAFSPVAFSGFSGITSLVIPDGVKNLTSLAHVGHSYAPGISNCQNLKSIKIGSGLEAISIYSCENLTSVEVGNGNTKVQIYNCKKLSDISLANASYLYVSDCNSLKTIQIPDGVTNATVSRCNSLTTLILGLGIKDNNGFGASGLSVSGCKELTDVYNPMFTPLKNAKNGFTEDCQIGYATLHVPESSIESYKATEPWSKFGNIVALKSGDPGYIDNPPVGGIITFADSRVEKICVDNWDTNGDGKLSEQEAAAVKDLGTVFKDNTQLVTFYELKYFTGLTAIADESFSGCTYLNYISIPEKVTSIGNRAFYNCANLKEIIIPSGVTSIGSSSFSYCKSLTEVVLPDNITSIGEYAFNSCYKLASLTLSKNLSVISNYAFQNCPALMSIDIPEGIVEIGDNAFGRDGWYSGEIIREQVTIPNSVKKVVSPFSGTTVKKLFLGTGITESPKNYTWGRFEEIHIPTLANWLSLPYGGISETPFRLYINDNEIKNLIIPEGTKEIDGSRFANCISIIDLNIPSSVSSIGSMAFSGCTGLISLKFSGRVKIGQKAFSDCTGITSILLPNNEQDGDIEMCAFIGCSSLKDVYCPIITPISIREDYNGYALNPFPENASTLHVPAVSVDAYKNARGWKKFANIVALQEGDPGYEEMNDVTLTAKSYTREYGEANPTFEYTVSNGTITSGTPAITCSATATSPVGTYDIVISKGTVSNSGTVNLVKGTLTITKAPLTISAGNYTKKEGEDNPEFTPVFTGFKNNETKAVLTKQPVVTTTATKASKAGNYTVSVSGAEAQNYSISYQTGTLTVTTSSTPVTNAEAYAVLVDDGKTVTFYYDDKKTSRGGIDINNRWIGRSNSSPYGTATKVVFDESFAKYRPESTSYWFHKCSMITTIIGLENLCTDDVTDMGGMFAGCSSLTSINLSNFNTDKVKYMYDMFSGCSSLTSLDLSGFNTTNVTNMGSMFYGCTNLKSLNVCNFNTANVTTMRAMFYQLYSLSSLDLSSFKTDKVEDMSFMFYGSIGIKTIYVGSEWNTTTVKEDTEMFANCDRLVGGQGTAYHYSHQDKSYAHIDEGTANPGYFTDINDKNKIVTLTAMSYTREYGKANPMFEWIVSDGTVMSGTPTITCSATAKSPVGTYDIIISKGTISNKGTVNLVKGTLTITKAPLTISAGNYTKEEGENNPAFTPTFSGFMNNETKSVLTKQPTITTTATKASKAGSYPVTISGAEAQNYSITYENGTLTVTGKEVPKVDVTLTAMSYTREYGQANPMFEWTVSDGTVTSGTPAITCSATATSPVGTYDIIISKGTVSNNGTVNLVKGTLTITKAPVTISAGNYTKEEGEDNPKFTPVFTGFKNNETETVLTKQPVITTTATKDSPAGDYEVTVSGAEAQNYSFSYQPGTLTVTAKPAELEPIEGETSMNTDELRGQDLSDNVVGNIYYVVGENGYDATDQSIVISQPTNMGQIADKEPGSKDVKENFNGMILKVAKGKGLITVNVKTSGNAQLVVQVGNGTPMLASKTEKGDVVFSYDVTEDTYVYIYAILGSSAARTTRAASDGDVRIYAVTVSPGATSIGSITVEGNANTPVYNLSGQQLAAPRKGLNIIGGKKVVVK